MRLSPPRPFFAFLFGCAALASGMTAALAAPAPDPRPPAAGGAPAPLPGAGHQARRERARERAFEQNEDAVTPMTPEQLGALIQSLETTEAVSSLHRPPQQMQTADTLDLNAAQPPVLRVVQGYGSSITFTDRTGKIWPITARQGFNKNLFDVEISTVSGDKDDLPTVLTVQALAGAGASNLVVVLKGLETPVILSLVINPQVADVRKTYKLPALGPNAEPEYQPASPSGVGGDLLNVSNGLPPSAAATRVQITGLEPAAMAWRDGGSLYLRTVAEVYSPEPVERSPSPSGLRAYKLLDVPVHLVSFNGNMTEMTVKE